MREKVEIKIEVVSETAHIPTYAHPDDAGTDIYASETVVIPGGKTVLVPTGIKVAIPEGFELQIRPRSGLSYKTPLRIPNTPGTIDSGFRDEVKVLVWNSSSEDFTVNAGDRIAQFVLARVPMAVFTQVESVADVGTNRGGGFGSTGIKG